MPKGERADGKRGGRRSAHAGGGLGIVIAGDPEPVAPVLEVSKRCAVDIREPRRAFAVVKTIAQRDHGARLVMPAFGAFAGGLNVRERAFADVFGTLGFVAYMLGEGRIYALAAGRCLAD